MYPVFRRAPDKSILVSTCRGITFDWMTARSDEIKQLGELNYQVVVVHSVEGVGFEELFVECRLERKASQFLGRDQRTVSGLARAQ